MGSGREAISEADVRGQTEGSEQVIASVCAQDCGGRCPLYFHVENGVIKRIEGDNGEQPRIKACSRGRAYRQKVYAADRLLHPMKRVGERGEGRFERITWDEALDTVAAALIRVRDCHGSSAIYYAGLSSCAEALLNHRDVVIRMLNRVGGFTPHWGGASAEGAVFATRATYGTLVSGHNRDDHLNSKLLVLWGWNPAVTIQSTLTRNYLVQAKEKGIKFVCVDPRYTDTAALLADQWIPIRPGTDAAMMIAMANVIITENLHDKAFIERYTVGFDQFKDYVTGIEDGVAKTPQWAEPITGVAAEVTRALAIEYATSKPAALIPGYGPGRTAYGEQYHRAAATLAAITGNVGVHGGNAAGFERAPAGVMMGPHIPVGQNPVITQHAYKKDPLSREIPRNGTIAQVKSWDAILRGSEAGYNADIKAMYVSFCNPLVSFPHVNKGIEALKSLQFIVVQDIVMSSTAKFADVLLPACTNVERVDVMRPWLSGPYYLFNNKVIEPLGESKSDFEIACELAKRLGIQDYSDKTEEEWLRNIIDNADDLRRDIPDYDGFKERGHVKMKFDEPPIAFKKQIEDLEHNPFPTPSGKIEIFSERLARLENPELPPIAKYIEPREGPHDPLAKRYPLQLITTHFRRRAHSGFDNVPWLRDTQVQAVWINAVDAEARKVRDGDLVEVSNQRGAVRLPAKVTERIMAGVVAIPEGAYYEPDAEGVDRGGSCNVLIDDTQSPAGAWATNTCLVQIEKVAG